MSPPFTNPNIVVELVYEHTTAEPMVIQRLDERNTLVVFAEDENIEMLCQTVQSISVWLGHSVHTGCNMATSEQMMVGEGLHQVGREESVSVEGASMQLPRLMSEPQHNISCPSIASQVVGKMPKFSTFSEDPTRKGEVSFEQGAFEVRSVMQNHTEVTLWEGIVWSLHRTTADLVQYLGLQALVAEIINKLEHAYGTMVSFDILMQKFYRLQQSKVEKVTLCNTIGGGTECGTAEISDDVEC